MYFYEDKGRQNRIVSFDGKNTMLLTVGYKYDKKGRTKNITRITTLKKTISDYKYDLYDNVVESITEELNLNDIKDPDIKIIKNGVRSTSSYEYDDNGNWISRLYRVDGEPVYIQVREIKYFPN